MAGTKRRYVVYRVDRNEGMVTVGMDYDCQNGDDVGKTVAEWSRLYGEDMFVKIFDTEARRG